MCKSLKPTVFEKRIKCLISYNIGSEASYVYMNFRAKDSTHEAQNSFLAPKFKHLNIIRVNSSTDGKES